MVQPAEQRATAALAGLDDYAGLAVVEDFGRLADSTLFTKLGPDWVIGVADVVRSRDAIAEGRYKTVNTVGAAVLAALANALGGRPFPYVFGGDGAGFALPSRHEGTAREALAATAAWARDELGLELRTALVPLEAVRAAGLEVRVARFAPSPHVSFAMFDGGGLAWAEAAMKRGEFAVPPAVPGTRPDLAGLSCRFEKLPAREGLILSLIVTPGPRGGAGAFSRLVAALLAETGSGGRRPVPEEGPAAVWSAEGIALEQSLRPRRRHPRLGRLLARLETLGAWLVFRTGMRLGGFDPARYLRELAMNTDFRKFDDGLRMTLDCSAEQAARIEAMLAEAAGRDIARYGTHRQDAALLTCFVPAPARSDHVHFVDGAAGGYAAAAAALEQAAGRR